MTDKQISLVKSSWKIFQTIDPVLVGDVFYSKLFIENPRFRQMFTGSTEEQSRKLIDMLSIIVGRLDRLHELSEEIRQLAIRHAGYGVKPKHYAAVGNALMWTLEHGLGQEWNTDVKAAWTECYSILSETMIQAAEENLQSTAH